MTTATKEAAEPVTGIALLRQPFPAHQISKLPKPTKAQTEEVRKDFKAGIRCTVCGSWHHPNVVHLDYVGHAALTDRLLDADPAWFWEPVAFRDGLPAFDSTGGLWIKLTVCGISRLGYGHAAKKETADPGAREKEVIGDALRNAAMRFGAALDLWHKGDLHGPDDDAAEEPAPKGKDTRPPSRGAGDTPTPSAAFLAARTGMRGCKTLDALNKWGIDSDKALNALDPVEYDQLLAMFKAAKKAFTDEEANPFEDREAA